METKSIISDYSKIISSLFPDDIMGYILPICDYQDHLHPDESKIIATASDKRKYEFSTGRWCAKNALNEVGIDDFPILSGKNREPIWPQGVSGSITHCKDICGTAISNSPRILSIGFDIENIKKFRETIENHICTNDELIWLDKQSSRGRHELILLLFSIKESLYKCTYSLNHSKPGFKDYSIIPDLAASTASLSSSSKRQLEGLSIKYHITKKHIYTSAIVSE